MLIMVCSASAASQKETSPPSPRVSPVEKSANTAAPVLAGKVVETMNAGGYTYVCLEKKGTNTWVAVPDMKVSVGKQMSFLPGSEMRNFTSKTLNRTFESIIFSGGPVAQEKRTGDRTASLKSPGNKAAVSPIASDIKVEKATGPDAYTVGEIFEKRTDLNKKTAVVKGKVVKVSAGIMGKNWIHVQDGTGNPEKKTHDLIITSQDLPSVGDVVTMKGTIYTDKDFGAGYKYDVIMEQGSIRR